MANQNTAGGSLIFYTGKNYAGTAQQVAHGAIGELAASSATWNYQSVALSAMEAYVFSTVNTAETTISYLGHVEAVISVSQTDLPLLYPSSDQFPLNYLGLDPAQAAVVWLDLSATQTVPNAVASTALPGGGTTSVTTLSLPGRPGALGFVAKTEGSSVVAGCRYGDYNSANGTVAWSGTGTLILEYTGGTVTLINAGGFPAGWTFSAPQLQGDGSWAVTLDGGVPASDTISSVTANPTSIVDDGVSSSVITATVIDGSGLPASGVIVTWSTDLGAMTPASSVTDQNGFATAVLKDNGSPGTARVTASITGSSKSVDVVVAQASTDVMLYQTTNFGGTSETLLAGTSDFLRNPLYQWNWQSVKPGNDRLLGHTFVGDITTFDFRTYRDSYDVVDNADLTSNYPILAGATVQGTSLANDDIVVRIALVSSNQNVVAVAQQTYPNGIVGEYLASLTNGGLFLPGILLVMNKSQGMRIFPLQVGNLDTTTGLVTWQTTTTLIASWNASAQKPEVILGSDAPADWVVYPPQATANAGEFLAAMSLNVGSLQMYCSTNAPLNVGAFVSVRPTNKVALYGAPGYAVPLSVTGDAVFTSSGTSSATVTLGSDGYGLAEVADTSEETVTVSATTSDGTQITRTMNFVDTAGEYAIFVNDLTPADNRTPCGYYWYDYTESGAYSSTVSLTGSAHFSDGAQSETFSLNNNHVLATSIFDSTAEHIAVTGNTPGYGPSTVYVNFVAVSTLAK